MGYSKDKNTWNMFIEINMSPFKLDQKVYDVIYNFIINNIDDTNDTKTLTKISNILEKYKLKLTNDYNISIVKSYYNILIGDIVYELDNGQIIYGSSFSPNYINKTEQLIIDFLSIADPSNELVRSYKLKKLKNGV